MAADGYFYQFALREEITFGKHRCTVHVFVYNNVNSDHHQVLTVHVSHYLKHVRTSKILIYIFYSVFLYLFIRILEFSKEVEFTKKKV